MKMIRKHAEGHKRWRGYAVNEIVISLFVGEKTYRVLKRNVEGWSRRVARNMKTAQCGKN